MIKGDGRVAQCFFCTGIEFFALDRTDVTFTVEALGICLANKSQSVCLGTVIDSLDCHGFSSVTSRRQVSEELSDHDQRAESTDFALAMLG
jgi:hypothetical protein